MKLAVSCSKFGVSGGMERYACDLVYGLLADDIKPTIITRKVDANLPDLGKLDIKKIHVSFIPGKLRDLYFSWQIARYKRKCGIDILIACSRIAAPDIAVCGGTHIGFTLAMNKKHKLSDKLHIYLERKQYHNAKQIIAHSELMQKELIQLYHVDQAKIKLIYPPVNRNKFNVVDDSVRQQLRHSFNFIDDKFYFLFPSGSHVRKGLPFLKKFFEQTDLPIELVVVSKNSVSGRNIKTVPPTPDIEQLYQAADATILASIYEPFGLVGIESVLCGTPIVFADNIGCCEVIDAPAKQVFEQGNYQQLAKAIEKIIQFDRSKQPDLSTCINYDISIEQHVGLINDLIESLR